MSDVGEREKRRRIIKDETGQGVREEAEWGQVRRRGKGRKIKDETGKVKERGLIKRKGGVRADMRAFMHGLHAYMQMDKYTDTEITP